MLCFRNILFVWLVNGKFKMSILTAIYKTKGLFNRRNRQGNAIIAEGKASFSSCDYVSACIERNAVH